MKHPDTRLPWPTFRALLRRPAQFLAFGAGAGLLPKAPGTWGTLLAVPLYLIVQDLPLVGYLLLLGALFALGVWVCGVTARALGVHDHAGIVFDEIVGYGITMIAAPAGWVWVAAGFVLFRVFDVWKPWPIALLDRRVAGGLGIMVDDVAAGIYALCCMQLLRLI